jgi:CDP-diacylglycerol---serine O-phosphatidyltransferase
MVRHLPNFLTSMNLLCGVIGIVATLEHWDIPGAYFIWIACVFDFLDGFTARLLKVSSPIGKELDSLADVVSFGVLPAMIMFTMFRGITSSYIIYAAFLIAIFSAIRLAIFNVDETQHDSFKGLPTPANAVFLSALPLQTGWVAGALNNVYTLAIITLVFSLLLVSRIDLFALKFKTFRWQDNQLRFVFLLITIVLVSVFTVAAIPWIILLYIGLSLSRKLFTF